MKNKTYIWTKLGALMLVILATSCFPDDVGNGNGLSSNEEVNAEFTVTPVAGKINTYVLKAEAGGVLGVKWDFGDGGGSALGSIIDTVFYPDAGDYTITLTAIGKGGKTATASEDVEVLTSDPNAGNLVIGGKMDAGDDAAWTFVTYSAGVTVGLQDGKMRWSGTGGHAGIYQEIQVEADKNYKVDMFISGPGSTDTWFEVYVGQATPVPGSDYSDGGARLALNTWAGCGNTAFNAKLSAISCAGSNGGVFSFEQSGTAYLFIRGGGGLGTISIDNVEVRGTN